jgi:hypothetical protein
LFLFTYLIDFESGRYGINLGHQTVSIAPFGPSVYNFHVGDVNVDYSPSNCRLDLPGNGARQFSIEGLKPSAKYTITACGKSSVATATSSGVVTFSADIDCTITVEVSAAAAL